MERNYQREQEALIAGLQGERPRLLLHSCCGPCSSSVLERLCEPFEVTLLWYNPNLYPEAEYDRRLETQLRLLREAGLEEKVHVLLRPWRSEDYTERIRGLENEPEHGRRCTVGIRLRLEETAKTAKELGFAYFCTTLSLSRHKNAPLINRLGEELAAAWGVAWLPSDFKKKGGELRSQELSRQYGLYRQNYCGCAFSLAAAERPQQQKEGNHPDP